MEINCSQFGKTAHNKQAPRKEASKFMCIFRTETQFNMIKLASSFVLGGAVSEHLQQ